ncbi:MAG TPA: hypothetical protein VFQ79_21655 [Bryobacteraceae bacterium]|nr:hypothetical protein [Bryobacteraceae bacterium]
MPMFLAGIGWVAEELTGNRFRWTIDPEQVVEGRFRGLPDQVVLQRAPLAVSFGDTLFADSPVFPVPLSWWQNLGNIQSSGIFPARVTLPQQVQAVRFTYAGPDAFFRAWESPGFGRTLVAERSVSNGEVVLLEASLIQELEFFTGAVQLQNVSILNLFADHAAGLNFESVARVSPRATMGMPLATAYQRYGGTATIDEENWAEFQEVLIPQAVASAPDSAFPLWSTPWQQVQLLLGARWEYAVVYGFGFLDGPDAGPGTSADQIGENLLQEMGSTGHVYRAFALFADGTAETSNLIVIPAFPAMPLPVPTNLGYANPEVRLYGEQTYTVTSSLQWHATSRRVIGVDIEEEVGPSPILDSATEVIAFTYRSSDPSAVFPAGTMARRFDVPFYDIPLRFRARSVDGWDRVSAFSPWSLPVVPAFIHNPQAPPLQDARFDGAQIALRAQTEHLSFTEWLPDHAVMHTPGSRLQVLRRVSPPENATVTLAEPSVYQDALNQQARLYSVPVPPIPDPGRFLGGYLTSGRFRAEILRHENGRYIFEPVSGSTYGTPMFEGGQATLQQSPNHPDLFTPVADFPVADLPHVLEFPDALAPAGEIVRIEEYGARVRFGAIRGAIGNVVQALVIPGIPEAPPPFSVEFLGVDFYDRTLVRAAFLQEITTGKYSLFWAEGNHDEESFDKAAVAGDYGAQRPQDDHHIYELFSLPVPRNQEAPVTFGAQRETDGAYKSGFTLVHTVVPVYGP